MKRQFIAFRSSEQSPPPPPCEVDPYDRPIRGDIVYPSTEMALALLVQGNFVAGGDLLPIRYCHLG
ncbi:hypothetical protein AA310_01255 [Arthrobacter sp. YC-RL1]|nr:hypothetical protein ATC04_18355 [Arthrobacter sp. YC-RL1]KLI90505.1 hypothetical protein AA310_01255 [Arthrobacter sp. YC-RL1]